jgi:magnesium transporter
MAPANGVRLATLSQGAHHEDLDADLDHLPALLAEQNSIVWLDLVRPTAEQVAALGRAFGLHELAMEDLRKRHQRAKVDTYPGHYVIVAYEPVMAEGADAHHALAELHLIAGDNYLAVVRWEDSPAVLDVDRRLRSGIGHLGRTSGGLLYGILDSVADLYFPVLDRMSERLEVLEDDIASGRLGQDALHRILVVKRELLELRRVVAPLRDVANTLLRQEVDIVDDASVPYYQDLYDHLVRILDTIDLSRELVAAAHDANLTVTSNALNKVVKRLTALTVILMVPTLIAGIYGMNFEYMPELSWPFGYAFALALMALSVGVAWVYFKTHDWF